jgi:hypothetical protein
MCTHVVHAVVPAPFELTSQTNSVQLPAMKVSDACMSAKVCLRLLQHDRLGETRTQAPHPGHLEGTLHNS